MILLLCWIRLPGKIDMKSRRILAKDANERWQIRRMIAEMILSDIVPSFQGVLIPRFRPRLEFPSISAKEFCDTQPMN